MLARYCARNPVAPERLQYDGPGAPVRYRSDKRDGPTAGTETVDPVAFLARLVTHIPHKHQVMTRYYGWYANRPRGGPRPTAGPAALARQAIRVFAFLSLTAYHALRQITLYDFAARHRLMP